MRTHSREYLWHLESPEWRRTVRDAIEGQGGGCAACGWSSHLQGHHLSYARLGEEEWYDVVALCETCHEVADRLREEVNEERAADFNAFGRKVRNWAYEQEMCDQDVGETWLEWFYHWSVAQISSRRGW